jgi:hypothetical protein
MTINMATNDLDAVVGIEAHQIRLWDNMVIELMQNIHKSHLQAFLARLEPFQNTAIQDLNPRKWNVSLEKKLEFPQQKRGFFNYIEEKYPRPDLGRVRFLQDLTSGIQMNLTINGKSVSLEEYLKKCHDDLENALRNAETEGMSCFDDFVGRKKDLERVRNLLRSNTDITQG